MSVILKCKCECKEINLPLNKLKNYLTTNGFGMTYVRGCKICGFEFTPTIITYKDIIIEILNYLNPNHRKDCGHCKEHNATNRMYSSYMKCSVYLNNRTVGTDNYCYECLYKYAPEIVSELHKSFTDRKGTR